MEKSLCIPLTIPKELDDYIHYELLPSIPDLPHTYTRRYSVTKIHDPLRQDDSAVLPSLQDTEAEIGNLRYWTINERNIWAGQHPVVDELFELYRAIFLSQSAVRPQVGPAHDVHLPWLQNKCDASDPSFILTLAHFLRRRVVPPISIAGNTSLGSNLDQTEELLFQAWILSDPGRCGDFSGDRRVPFDQDDYPNPVTDSLFWKEGEGQWPCDFVPDWIKAPRTHGHEEELIRDNIRRDDTRDKKLRMYDRDLGFAETQVRFSKSVSSRGSRRTFAGLQDCSYSESDEDDVDEDILEEELSSNDE